MIVADDSDLSELNDEGWISCCVYKLSISWRGRNIKALLIENHHCRCKHSNTDQEHNHEVRDVFDCFYNQDYIE